MTPLKLILEPEGVVAIVLLQEIEQLGRSLHDGERRLLGVVEDDGDAAVGIEAEEPIFLLFIGHDVAALFEQRIAWRAGLSVLHHGVCPFDTIEVMQFFEHDLDLLAVGCVHGDEVKSLRVQ